MADAIITVEGLGKHYRLAHQGRPDTLRDSLMYGARKVWRRLRWNTRSSYEEFWALRDVSFDVKRGEVLGIIGRNGAGKSTLLKILSRITEPTTGRVTLRGRVTSLLEVGTGFHPELTGRENVYLNGAILGMSRAETSHKFDEIVAFAEVERFLDTPVKHYSSGMYVRLAFAVAAHLEPEILIVDEVLAVGDIAFQRKCLGKMQDVARTEGRTVVFVSHNLSSVRQLCRSALHLAGGRLRSHGTCAQVLEEYLRGPVAASAVSIPKPAENLDTLAFVTGVAIESLSGIASDTFPVGQSWRVRIAFRVNSPQCKLRVAMGIKSFEAISVQTAWTSPDDYRVGDFEALFVQDRVVLEAGSYSLLVGLAAGERSLQQFEAARFHLTSEGATTGAPATSGMGLVLNSMDISVRPY